MIISPFALVQSPIFLIPRFRTTKAHQGHLEVWTLPSLRHEADSFHAAGALLPANQGPYGGYIHAHTASPSSTAARGHVTPICIHPQIAHNFFRGHRSVRAALFLRCRRDASPKRTLFLHKLRLTGVDAAIRTSGNGYGDALTQTISPIACISMRVLDAVYIFCGSPMVANRIGWP